MANTIHVDVVSAEEQIFSGDVEFVQKPTALATDRVFEIADELLAKVKAAASAVMLPRRTSNGPPAERSSSRHSETGAADARRVKPLRRPCTPSVAARGYGCRS